MSKRVHRALEAGWNSALGGFGAIQSWCYEARPGRGEYHFLDVRVGERSVQIAVSPKGNSVHIHVDGEAITPAHVARRRGSRTKRR